DYRYNLLFHGRGDGAFARVTDNVIALDEIPQFAFEGSWADIDNDGDHDLLVHVVNINNALYRNDGHGRFTRLTDHVLELRDASTGFGSWGDFDNDGDLDRLSEAGLAVNNGQGDFQPSPLEVPGAPACVDIDNDGFLDFSTFNWELGISLYRNTGQGTFEPIVDPLPGFTMKNAWGPWGAWGDGDNDGDMDLFVTFEGGGPWYLYRNESKVNRWLKLQLTGTAANRSAIGSKVRVKATIGGRTFWQMREVQSSTFSIRQNDTRPNFGLGDATVAEEVRIEWPSGNLTVLTNVTANQILDVTEVVNIEPARPVTVINGTVNLTHTLAASSRQWYSESGALAGQTGQILTLTGLQPSQAGRYTVVAQTATGSQTNHVYLRVLSPALAATRVAEGIRIECRGDPATGYTLQSSALVTGSWAEEQTLTTDAAGVATATVPIEAGSRFLRVVKE
ncbi:MAG: CRTAC1 family protein, partial [Nitrospira sp.]|nr:CRTAC1 family protein [Nitrospira sp.]